MLLVMIIISFIFNKLLTLKGNKIQNDVLTQGSG